MDIAHASIESPRGRRARNFIERFAPRIGHLHVSDHKGRSDDHLPVGKGRVAFAPILAALHATGYDATVTLEVFTDDRRHIQHSRRKVEALLQG